MGSAKNWLMEQEERGYWSVGDKYICPDCIGEPAIQTFIERHSVSNPCSYCDSESSDTIAAEFDDVAGFILAGLQSEWGDPDDEGVAWEGGWVGEVIDTYDILFDKVELEIESEQLRRDLLHSLEDHQWCRKDFYLLNPSEVLTFGWSRFVDLIKHKARFVFIQCPDPDEDCMGKEEIPPRKFLDAFGSVLHSLRLYRKLPAGTTIHRVRPHSEDEAFETAAELGPPPIEYCIYANRMSPAGIPMFYGAFDVGTCIAETYDPDTACTTGTVGTFTTASDMLLLDLTRLPAIPSIFESNGRERRHNLFFLRDFLEDFSRPVKKDGSEHIEYVPTQVVAEYVRHIHRHPDGAPIDGILYPSAKAKGKSACVLFIDNDCVADPGDATDKTRLILKNAFAANAKEYLPSTSPSG